jgi:hypothetical protein
VENIFEVFDEIAITVGKGSPDVIPNIEEKIMVKLGYILFDAQNFK